MTKDEARQEALRLWRSLPVAKRQTFEQAEAFAQLIQPPIDFESLGGKLKVTTAWLQRDILDVAEIRRSSSFERWRLRAFFSPVGRVDLIVVVRQP